MSEKKKSKNLTDPEKKFFVKIVQKYVDIVESEKSSTATLNDKKEVWEKIRDEFNQSTITTTEKVSQNYSFPTSLIVILILPFTLFNN